MKSTDDIHIPSSKTSETKIAVNPGSTNPNSNLKFITPYYNNNNNVDPNELPVKSNGEVATVTVDLTKFNVSFALEENSRFLDEWGKLLEKTGNYV